MAGTMQASLGRMAEGTTGRMTGVTIGITLKHMAETVTGVGTETSGSGMTRKKR